MKRPACPDYRALQALMPSFENVVLKEPRKSYVLQSAVSAYQTVRKFILDSY